MVHVIGIGEMKTSDSEEDQIVTYALGSCLGVTIYDPVVRVGGMVHLQLPSSRSAPDKAAERPCMFVDTGVPRLFREAYGLGARKDRIEIKVAGGAQILDERGHFKIGERNYAMLRKLLWKNGLLIQAEDVGGTVSRTLSIDVGTGQVLVRSDGKVYEL